MHHVFIWMDQGLSNISASAQAAIASSNNTILLSYASIRELQIKTNLGKLQFRLPLPDVIRDQQRNNIQLSPIALDYIYKLDNLPNHHKDPFDRLLIAQARIEQIPIVTNDAQIARYAINVVWE